CARLSGWEAKVRTPAEALDGGGHWLVVACDPRQLGAKQTQALRARLETEALLVVMRTPQPVDPLCGLAGASIGGRRHAGRELGWQGPGEPLSWRTREPIEGSLDVAAGDVEVWATLDGAPLIAARPVGRGIV